MDDSIYTGIWHDLCSMRTKAVTPRKISIPLEYGIVQYGLYKRLLIRYYQCLECREIVEYNVGKESLRYS